MRRISIKLIYSHFETSTLLYLIPIIIMQKYHRSCIIIHQNQTTRRRKKSFPVQRLPKWCKILLIKHIRLKIESYLSVEKCQSLLFDREIPPSSDLFTLNSPAIPNSRVLLLNCISFADCKRLNLNESVSVSELKQIAPNPAKCFLRTI